LTTRNTFIQVSSVPGYQTCKYKSSISVDPNCIIYFKKLIKFLLGTNMLLPIFSLIFSCNTEMNSSYVVQLLKIIMLNARFATLIKSVKEIQLYHRIYYVDYINDYTAL